MTDQLDRLSTSLAEQYLIEGEIGSGGMATVCLAHDIKHERKVAIKVLRPELAAVIGAERFLNEIRVTANLQHPHILPLHDSGEADGQLYYVMPYIEGESLREKMNREKQLPLDEALEIAKSVASALDYAHRHDVIHRDIKPENILLHEGQPVVADFGIALAVSSATRPRLTDTGLSLGTPEYMSPEQATGDRQLDARSDVYSLGCVLYEMLAGEPPHTGPTVQAVIARVLTDEAPDVRSTRTTVPAPVAAAIAKALEKVPSDRFPSADAFATALRPSRAMSMPAITWQALRRRRRAVALAAVATAVVLVSVVSWALLQLGGSPTVSEDRGRLSLLVSSADRAFDPDLSPDGSMVVHVAGDWNRVDLFVRRVRGGEPVQITDDAAVETEPVFSPDGERIAFTRLESLGGAPGIWIMPTFGGAALPVAQSARSAAWSPDGSRLAFVEEQPGENYVIVTATPDGGDRKVVFENEAPYLALYSPTWSPDGAQLAMVRSMGGTSGEIWLIPAEGGTPRRLSDDPPGVVERSPVYEPGGKAIIYSSNRAGTTNLWRTPLDGGRSTRLTTGAGPDRAPSISRDGSIAYVNSRSRPVLLAYDRKTLERRTLVTHSASVWAPAFSPDGQEIAFSRAEVDGAWHIWVLSLSDTSTRRLTTGAPPQVYPRFTPDGSSVIYMTWTTPGRVWRVPREGGAPMGLTPTQEDAGYGDVSPDGRSLAYVRSEGGTTHIYIAPIEGGAARRLLDKAATLPRWSPDGRWIAFTTNRSFVSGIFVIRPDGTDERRLSETGGWPTWFPDGKRVGYVVVGPDGRQRLYTVSLDGADSMLISSIEYQSLNSPFDVSPDGILIATSDGVHLGDEIWILERAR